MRRIGRDIGKEWLVAVTGDEIHRTVEEDIRAVALALELLAIAIESRVEVVIAARRIGGLPNAAAMMRQRFLEALILRTQGTMIAQMPLAEQTGTIARAAQDFGERDLIAPHHRTSEISIDDAGAIVIASGHQTRTRRRTDRIHMKLVEADALFAHAVEVRGVEIRIAVQRKIAEALIVRDDQDHVGAFALGRCGNASGHGAEQQFTPRHSV